VFDIFVSQKRRRTHLNKLNSQHERRKRW